MSAGSVASRSCWLCEHPVTESACADCGCLAHYPPWTSRQSVPCHVRGCIEHVEGMHVDYRGDALVHVGCGLCAGGTYVGGAA